MNEAEFKDGLCTVAGIKVCAKLQRTKQRSFSLAHTHGRIAQGRQQKKVSNGTAINSSVHIQCEARNAQQQRLAEEFG